MEEGNIAKAASTGQLIGENPKDKSELTRAHHMLNMQTDAIHILQLRLSPVSKISSMDTEDKAEPQIGNNNLFELSDKIQINNARINELINQLAV